MTRLILILLGGLLGVPWSVIAQDATVGSLRGIVFDTSTPQKSIEGVRVVIVGPASSEYETVTDSNGEYEITGLPPGRYLMNLYKDGYGRREGNPIVVVAGATGYTSMKMTKSEPPWLMIIGLGVVAILIVGLVVAAVSRTDNSSD